MLHLNRRNLPAVGVATAAVAFAALSPVLASSGPGTSTASEAKASTKVQSKTTFREAPGTLDDFDTCAFTTVLTHAVKAPKAGYLQVTGIASAARDVDDPDNALLRADVTVNTAPATPVGQTLLTKVGNGDGSISTSGVVKVPKGKSIVRLRLSECETGMAFVVERAVLAEWHAFGSIAPAAPRVAGATNG